MSNEDYRQGFKDGFEAGLAEGKKQTPIFPKIDWPGTTPDFNIKSSCPKCGMQISGIMGYVCTTLNCPTFPNIAFSTGQFSVADKTEVKGAVGSSKEYKPRNGEWYDEKWYPDRSR